MLKMIPSTDSKMTVVFVIVASLLSLALGEAALPKLNDNKVIDPVDDSQQQYRGQRESGGYGYSGQSYYYPQQQWNSGYSGYNSYNRYPSNYQYQYYQTPVGYYNNNQQYYQGGSWYPSGQYYRGINYNTGGFGYNNGGYYTNSNLGFGGIGRYNSQAYGAPIRQGYY